MEQEQLSDNYRIDSLEHQLGLLRQEFADFRNSLPTIIAKQIESYMLLPEND